jgi:hypothetical protein
MATTKLFISEPFEIPFATLDNHSVLSAFELSTSRHSGNQKLLPRTLINKVAMSFTIRAGRGYRVWYVGKTKNKFSVECFQSHKLEKYNEVLFEGRRGTPVMFFIAPKDGVKVVDKHALASMELSYVQEIAYAGTPELKNVHGTNPDKWVIDGVIRSGQGKAVGQKQGVSGR